jgi:arabinogalactan endo-1,4-beta-galactosidase
MRARINMRQGALIALFAWFVLSASAAQGEFLAGADFSHLAFFESRGVVYRDAGQVQDGLGILKQHGLNCVRLRLFTSSAAQASANPYNYINNATYTYLWRSGSRTRD